MPQSPSQPTPPRAAEADELPTADAIRYRLVANAMRLHTISLRVSRGVVNPNLGTAAAKIEAEAGKAWARAYDALRDREESEIVARYEKIKRDLDKASGEGRRSHAEDN